MSDRPRPKPTLPDPGRREERERTRYIVDPMHPERRVWMTQGALVMFIVTSIMLIAIGVFQVIFYTSMRDFVSCQAQFNQQSSVARKARLDSQADENRSLYLFLNSIQPLLKQNLSDKERQKAGAEFASALEGALQTHRKRIETERKNPYPQEPEETCGNF